MEDEGEIVELFGQDTLFGWLIIRAVRRIQKKGFSIDLCLLPIEENWSNKFDHVSESIIFLTAARFPFSVESKHLQKKSRLVYFLFLKAHYYYVNLPAGAFKDALTSSTKHDFLLTVNTHTHPYLVPLPDSNSHGKSGTWKKRHAQTLAILVRQTQVQTAGNQSPEKTCKHRHRHRKSDVGITLISQM